MAPKLKIDLSHETERVRFSRTPPLIYQIVMYVFFFHFWGKGLRFEADSLHYTNLNSKCQNVLNMGNTQKCKLVKVALLNSVAKYKITETLQVSSLYLGKIGL